MKFVIVWGKKFKTWGGISHPKDPEKNIDPGHFHPSIFACSANTGKEVWKVSASSEYLVSHSKNQVGFGHARLKRILVSGKFVVRAVAARSRCMIPTGETH